MPRLRRRLRAERGAHHLFRLSVTVRNPPTNGAHTQGAVLGEMTQRRSWKPLFLIHGLTGTLREALLLGKTRIRGRFLLLAALIVVSMTAAPGSYSRYDRASYAPKQVIDFVRPGLVFKITGAQIASDGTITAHVLVTDPAGLPLDINGITTPGAVSMSFIAATIPNGQTQYVA